MLPIFRYASLFINQVQLIQGNSGGRIGTASTDMELSVIILLFSQYYAQLQQQGKLEESLEAPKITTVSKLQRESCLTLLGPGSSQPASRAARARAKTVTKMLGPHRSRGAFLRPKRDFLCRSAALNYTCTAAVSPPGNTPGTSVLTLERSSCPQNITAIVRSRQFSPWSGNPTPWEQSKFSM